MSMTSIIDVMPAYSRPKLLDTIGDRALIVSIPFSLVMGIMLVNSDRGGSLQELPQGHLQENLQELRQEPTVGPRQRERWGP